MLARSLATEDPSKKNLFSKNRQEKRAFLKQPIRFLYRLLQCFFRLSSVKIYFSIVAFQKTPVSLENLNHFSGHHPLTPLMHFGNFSLTVFLKKLKKEQFDSSYFCDSRYIYIYISRRETVIRQRICCPPPRPPQQRHNTPPAPKPPGTP